MANEKELTELYSGPGAESFRVFEDENGRVRAVQLADRASPGFSIPGMLLKSVQPCTLRRSRLP